MRKFCLKISVLFIYLTLFGCSVNPEHPPEVKAVEQHAKDTGQKIHADAQQALAQYCAQPYETRLMQHKMLMTAATVGAAAAGAPPVVGMAAQAAPPFVMCPGDPGYVAPVGSSQP